MNHPAAVVYRYGSEAASILKLKEIPPYDGSVSADVNDPRSTCLSFY